MNKCGLQILKQPSIEKRKNTFFLFKMIILKKIAIFFKITIITSLMKLSEDGIELVKSVQKRTGGNQRRYWYKFIEQETPEDIKQQQEISEKNNNKRTILYARVSTRGQSESLERQIKELKEFAKSENIEEYDVISDIGSGINFKRKGFKTILDRAEKKLSNKSWLPNSPQANLALLGSSHSHL